MTDSKRLNTLFQIADQTHVARQLLFFITGLFIFSVVLINLDWTGDEALHTVLETAASVAALVVGCLAFVRFYSQQGSRFLFFSVGFLGTAVFDTFHTLITSSFLNESLTSPATELTPWSWLLSRTFLSVFMVLAAISSRKTDGPIEQVYPGRILLAVSVTALACFVIFVLAPLPPVVYTGAMIARPLEIVPGILFLFSFVVYYRANRWKQDPFLYWILFSLLANAVVQLFLMPWSTTLYDAAFNWAHVGKILAYAIVFLGLADSLSNLVRSFEQAAAELRLTNASLEAQIKERIKAEKSIRMYQSIVDNMNSGVTVLRLEDWEDVGSFRVMLMNQAVEEITGRPVAPYLGKTLTESSPASLETGIPQLYRKVLKTKQPVSRDDIHYAADGIDGYFSLSVFPLDENSVGVVFNNITERKRREKELQASQSQLAEAQQIAQLGSWEWLIQEDKIQWSDQLYRIYGYEPGEIDISLSTFVEHIHPDDQAYVQWAINETLNTGSVLDYYFRAITANGEELIIRGLGRVEYDEEGNPLRMWGTAQDVTQPRRVRQWLEKSQARLAQAQRLAQLGHWDWDLKTNQVELSEELARIFGYEPELRQIDFTEFVSLIHPEDRERVQRVISQAIERNKSFDVEFRVVHSDGTERVIHGIGQIAVYENNQPVHLAGTGQDVTERFLVDQKLKHYNAQLEASNRELQDFAYIASHDLQEPLRKIVAFGDRIHKMDVASSDAKLMDYLDRMQSAARRMQTLINDLLNLSRVTTKGRPFVQTNLNQIVQGVLSDLETAIDESQTRVSVEELPTIDADPLQMRQLFQNLIANSIKFRQEDTLPEIRISSETLFEGGRSLSRMTFQDNGVGFDAKYAEKIFEPFQRLYGRQTYEGTGMGLAIVRKIVERHEGTIFAQSAPGEGTRMILTLPIKHQIHPNNGSISDAQPEALNTEIRNSDIQNTKHNAEMHNRGTAV